MTEHPQHSWAERLSGWLFSPKLTVICLAFLMVLTFWGTLYQVQNGLFAAQQRFYNSYLILLGGFVPFPGTQLVLAVLLINLVGYLVKLMLKERLKIGIALTHLGILILLLGGAITHHFAELTQLTLLEGETSSVSSAYNDWEIAAWKQEGDTRDVWAMDADSLKAGDVVDFPALNLEIEVESFFQNAKAFQSAALGDVKNRMGITSLEPVPLEKEPERNIAGGVFAVRQTNVSSERPRRLLLYGEDISEQPFKINGDDYVFALRHRRHVLPVTVTLLDFQREMHPGTELARSFSSRVAVASDGGERNLTLSMNKPLRYRGYTVYQASYSELPNGQQSSTFAVAKNYGRLIPYIATSIVVLGMIVHFVAMLVSRTLQRGAAV